MADEKKKVEGSYLEYNGKPLVRQDGTIIYGDMNTDPAVLILEIMSTKKDANGTEVPDKILIQVVDSKDTGKILKQGSKSGLYDAFSLGLIWLESAIKAN